MPSSGKTRQRSEHTRAAILHAAIHEFGAWGASGARTEAIAAAAGVNKALLYHYFQSKTELHRAALRSVFEGVLEQTLSTLQREGPAGERLLRWALQHFDRLVEHPEYRRLMQQEFVRVGREKNEIMPQLVKTALRTALQQVRGVIEEGIRSGELCPMDPSQAIYSILGPNVFYFLSAAVMHLAAGVNPLAPSSLQRRREGLLAFLSLALFTDRKHGAALVRRILADTPMPAQPRSRRMYS